MHTEIVNVTMRKAESVVQPNGITTIIPTSGALGRVIAFYRGHQDVVVGDETLWDVTFLVPEHVMDECALMFEMFFSREEAIANDNVIPPKNF